MSAIPYILFWVMNLAILAVIGRIWWHGRKEHKQWEETTAASGVRNAELMRSIVERTRT